MKNCNNFIKLFGVKYQYFYYLLLKHHQIPSIFRDYWYSLTISLVLDNYFTLNYFFEYPYNKMF